MAVECHHLRTFNLVIEDVPKSYISLGTSPGLIHSSTSFHCDLNVVRSLSPGYGKSYRCLVVKTRSVFDALLKLSTTMARSCLPFMIVGFQPLQLLSIFNLASFSTSLACSPPFCIMVMRALASFTSIELNLRSAELIS